MDAEIKTPVLNLSAITVSNARSNNDISNALNLYILLPKNVDKQLYNLTNTHKGDRKILRISSKDHVTNEEVRANIQQAIRPHEDLLTMEKRRKLQ